MNIYFCDLCNESVPQADLDLGRAFVRKGRVVCATCDRTMSAAEAHGGAPTTPMTSGTLAPASPASAFQPAAVRPGRGAALLATGALLVAAGGAAVLLTRQSRLEAELREARGALAADLRRVDRRLAETAALVRAQESDLGAHVEGLLFEERTRVDSELGQLEAEARRRADDLARVSESAESVRKDLAQTRTEHRVRAEELATRVEQSESDLHAHAGRLSQLEIALADAAPIADEPKAGGPAWEGLLVDLASADALARLQAVDALRQTRDRAVVQHLVPRLKDDDVFVRMATARALGDLLAHEAIGALIDALEDREAPVREAALVALMRISGRDFKFDPLASEADRAKRVKAWREWWTKEQGAEE